jgi:hypothetical protein
MTHSHHGWSLEDKNGDEQLGASYVSETEWKCLPEVAPPSV